MKSVKSKYIPYQIKRSAIHGRGLFARKELKPGYMIGTYEGTPTKRNGPYVLWMENRYDVWCGISGKSALRFVNHSVTPNCIFRQEKLFVLSPIKEGEEITCHYGEDWI